MWVDSYGAKGYRATSASHFEELLHKCVSEEGVKLLEVPIDYEWANSVLDKELPGLLAATHNQNSAVRAAHGDRSLNVYLWSHCTFVYVSSNPLLSIYLHSHFR